MNPARWPLAVPLCLLALALSAPALAQYDEDEQTRDHEEQDRLYLERRQETPATKAPAAEDPESAQQAFLARADRLIRDRNHRATNSEGYRVQSDDPGLDTKAAAELLESFRNYFERFWGRRIERVSYDRTSYVYLFYSFHKFNQLLGGDFRYRSARPKGHYDAFIDAITLYTDSEDGPDGLANALVHEAAHQLIDQQIFSVGHFPAGWISEGLASYFGFTYRDKTGSFRTGAIGGKSIQLQKSARGGGKESSVVLQNARQAFKSARGGEEPVTLTVISITDPDRFYGDRALEHYAVSWALVHYLMHGEDGALANRFIRYLELEARGEGGPDALYRQIGMAADELEAATARHVKGLKTH